MLAQEVLRTIEAVVHANFGETFTVLVALDGFRVHRSKAAKAELIGAGALIARVSVEGWGPTFEPRTATVQIVVDRNQAKDDLVQSVLDQTALLAREQLRQRARAAALGLTSPLDADRFRDLARFTMDIDCARVLRSRLKSDMAVRTWLEDALRSVWNERLARSRTTPLRVHGLHLTVPLLLRPLEMVDRAEPSRGRPIWLDDEIRILFDDYDLVRDSGEGGEALVVGTPLAGRKIRDAGVWPPTSLSEAVLRWERLADPRRERETGRPSVPIEKRFEVERRLISVSEAFG